MSTKIPLHSAMPYDEIEIDELVKSLVDSFNVLADEVQLLSDRKTVLEHKLRFAHEQYQYLADKYAPLDLEISNTLAKLQLPPELKLRSPDRASFVPLPSRRPSGSKQQTAEVIRDGRRTSQKLASLRGWKNLSDIGRQSTSGSTDSVLRTSRLGTSATSVFEQDFTVPGKKGELLCPFAKMANTARLPNVAEVSRQTSRSISGPKINSGGLITTAEAKATIHPPSADPICAALYSESHSSPPPSVSGSTAKCPIRFLDQHSPEEVAKYFETHKHEIPRSHEVCVKRYQRNEEDIRKLDAKYGNLVSMISGLGQKHQPMLQVKGEDFTRREDERKPNERVQNWAKAVSSEGVDTVNVAAPIEDDEDREGRFERPLREIRIGESPSRPWGISVPNMDKLNLLETVRVEEPVARLPKPPAISRPPQSAKECPLYHNRDPKNEEPPEVDAKPVKATRPPAIFVEQSDLKTSSNGPQQMVFTGPVFIGYTVEQAMTLVQQWQSSGIANDRP